MNLIGFLGFMGIVFIVWSISVDSQKAFRVGGIIGSLFFLTQAVMLGVGTLVFFNTLLIVLHCKKLLDNTGKKA